MRLIHAEFEPWIRYTEQLGFSGVMTPEDGFSTELVTGEKWHSANACGIYAWITGDMKAYVGQAVSVRNRLRQHWKNYRDMAYATFQHVEESKLDEVEGKLIASMETRYPILNIKFAKSSAQSVPFDDIVNQSETNAFLSGAPISKTSSWKNWPLLENKQQHRYSTFTKKPECLTNLAALKIYIERCIPLPQETEVKFWSVSVLSCKPNYLRINVGQQEVFTVCDDGNAIFVRVLSRSKLSQDCEGPLYATHSFANFIPIEDFDKWLDTTKVLRCRELVVWLMRHTVPMNSGSHFPQLVRAAFDH